jgi:flagellar export protein FliJ
MRKLRFARIRRLKARERKSLTEEIAMLRDDLAAVERAMVEAAAALDANRNAAAVTAAAGQSAIELHLHAIFEAAQTLCRERLAARARSLATVIEERRGALVERRREERQFEVLERKDEAREADARARAEAAFHDDLARRPKRDGSDGR